MSLLMGSGLLHTVTAGFTPLDLSGLAAWLPTLATSDTTLSGTAVTGWVDRSGTMSNWAQGTSGLRPTRASATAPIVYDGVDDTLTSVETLSNVITSTAAWGAFCVVRINSNSTGSANPWQNNMIAGNSDQWWALAVKNTAAPYDIQFYLYDTEPADIWITAAGVAPASGWVVIQWWHDGANINLEIDGVAATPEAAAALNAGALGDTVSVGKGNSAPGCPGMDVADFVLIDGVPSAQDRADYLSWAQGAYGV